MKKHKKILTLITIFLLLIVISIVSFCFYLKPKYSGSIKLLNIQKETTVYFDEFGVPHIYAQTQNDAMVALGYVHAQDRLWQMELLKRIAPGRLSEIFGSKVLKTDLFFAGLGIDEASEKAISQLDVNAKSVQLANSYLKGINQFIANGPTPIEFYLLGIEKKKFNLKDVYNVFGYMAFSFAMAQKTDPLLTDLQQKLDYQYLKDLGINGSLNTTQLKSFEGKINDYSEISKAITLLLKNSNAPSFIGSNSWVIAPQKTKNGKVIFANDPHIGFSQPCTWYEAHIVSPDYEMYGFHLAGTPFPLLGHNQNYAYGLTMFENDDVDFYTEKNNSLNDKEYISPNGILKYETRKKTIKVKDSADVYLNLKISRHGPIVNSILDGIPQKNPVAMSWIYTQQPIKILEATYSLCHVKNLTDFKNNISLIAAPGLNIMYGDANGNIAWATAAKLYKHKNGVNTNFILDGASGNDDITAYLDFSKNPQAINPPWHFVYSANNQPEAIEGYLYPGYYLPEDRAKRIEQLLTPKNDWTKEAVGKMITDNTSSTALSTIKIILSQLNYTSLTTNEKVAYAILKSWKANNNKDEIAPTIFNKFLYCHVRNTFQDEMGEENFKQFLSTHLMKQVNLSSIKNKNSIWWDDISTKNQKETQRDIISKSFHEAINELENQLGNSVNSWSWNKVHTTEHQHPIGKIALLRSFFNVGPFESNGSNEVIDNQFFDYSSDGIYNVKGGPSTRRVIDFSDIENSWSILPTGQSGNPLSKHYKDQAKMYNDGRFRKMKLNKKEIVKNATKLVFIPNK